MSRKQSALVRQMHEVHRAAVEAARKTWCQYLTDTAVIPLTISVGVRTVFGNSLMNGAACTICISTVCGTSPKRTIAGTSSTSGFYHCASKNRYSRLTSVTNSYHK